MNDATDSKENVEDYTESFRLAIKKIPEKDRVRVVEEGINKEVKTEDVRKIGRRLEPSQRTKDCIWMITVISFAIVMVLSFFALAYGAFFSGAEEHAISGELILSVFTAAVGFFAGIFAPSPGKE